MRGEPMWGVEEEGLGLGDWESMEEAEGLGGVVELPIVGDWSLWEAEDLRGETLRWMRGLLAAEEVVKEGRLATLSWEPLRSMDWRQERMRSEGAELKESRFDVREARVVVEGLRLRIFLEKVEMPSQFSARRRLR